MKQAASAAPAATGASEALPGRIRGALASIRLGEKQVLWIVLALLFWKNALYLFGVHFDSDQALLGLVGVKLSHWESLTVLVYGQRYLFALESWLAAPLFALFGPSITALKLPLFLMQVVVGAVFCRAAFQSRLSGPSVLLALSPFLVTTPWMSMVLVAAHGCNPEPFLATALAWVLRKRPVALGLVTGLLFMVRPFAAYALVALVLLDVFFCRKPFAKRTREWAATGGAFALVAGTLTYLAPKGTDYGGPESPKLSWNPRWAEDLVFTFKTHVLPACGLSPGRIGYEPLSLREDALDGLTTLLKWTMVFVVGRILWGLWRATRALGEVLVRPLPHDDRPDGLGAHGLPGGDGEGRLGGAVRPPRHAGPPRPAHPLFPARTKRVGPPLGRPGAGAQGGGALRSLGRHSVRLREGAASQRLHGQRLPRPRGLPRRARRHVGPRPYWVSYHVSFLTKERVKLTESDRYAIGEYKRLYDQRLPNSVNVQERPCTGGTRVAAWYVCPRVALPRVSPWPH